MDRRNSYPDRVPAKSCVQHRHPEVASDHVNAEVACQHVDAEACHIDVDHVEREGDRGTVLRIDVARGGPLGQAGNLQLFEVDLQPQPQPRHPAKKQYTHTCICAERQASLEAKQVCRIKSGCRLVACK